MFKNFSVLLASVAMLIASSFAWSGVQDVGQTYAKADAVTITMSDARAGPVDLTATDVLAQAKTTEEITDVSTVALLSPNILKGITTASTETMSPISVHASGIAIAEPHTHPPF